MLFGPGVPGREALGAQRFEDFMGEDGGALAEEHRAELVEEQLGRRVLRVPLPGTPGADGRFTGPPKGAGTGWVRVVRYRGAGLFENLRARFTAPRSASPGARDWNLLCHLRACGVGTPEPLAVGSASESGFSARSFLVTRELERAARLDDWLAAEREPGERQRGVRALAEFLARLFRSRVRLPRLSVAAISIGAEREACADEAACDEPGAPVAGKRLRRSPPVFLTDVTGGRILEREPGEDEVLAVLERGFGELAPGILTPREAVRILRAVLGGSADRETRRMHLRDAAKRFGFAAPRSTQVPRDPSIPRP